ncbi:hypothetical protein Tco_0400687 [Tanacetum coccineum]
MKIQDLIKKRIEKAGQHLNKEKQIMHTNKGKEKMVMERATSDESFDHNLFQVTSDESSDDTLKSSSEDTCSSDYVKKPTIPLDIVQWYDDYQRTIYKGRRGLSFRNVAIRKPEKPTSMSKHLAPTTRTGSTCTTLVVPTKMPPPVTNCVLGLAAVTTWQ